MNRKLVNSMCIFLMLSLAGISTAGNIDPSLVGWWSFEDGIGTAARDGSGKSVDAEIFGNFSWRQENHVR